MLTVYPACFFKESNGYSVVFPDLNWLSTCGDSVQDAMEMAIDCLAGHIYMSQKLGEQIPAPSNIADINIEKVEEELDLQAVEAIVNLVSVDVKEYAKTHFEKAVKKTLSIPMWLNSAAEAENINFSKTLQEALKVKLNIL